MTDEFEKQWGQSLLSVIETVDNQMCVVNDGRVVCCVGLIATFYFLDGDRPEVRERVVRAYETYQKAIGDKLIWGADPKTHRPKKLAGTQIANVRSWVSRIAPGDDLEFVYHGGKDKNDANAYMTKALVQVETEGELSYFTFGVPLAWLVPHSLQGFVKLVLEVSEILRPEHGYAGFGIIDHVASSSNSDMAVVTGFAKRFSGLEIDDPGSHSIYLSNTPAIKGVNWLTVLGQSWLDKLGGETAVIAELGEGPTLHPFDGGAIVQAGPRPLLGDRNQNEPMVAYRQVAKALKPIRSNYISSIASAYGFNKEQTTQWLQRFDD